MAVEVESDLLTEFIIIIIIINIIIINIIIIIIIIIIQILPKDVQVKLRFHI
jgi:hypothetical protein